MKKKVAILVGTRPNFIKITQFDKEFKAYGDHFEYKLIHAGQHYDKNMSEIFFTQLGLKKPDVVFDIKGLPPAKQIGHIIIKLSDIFDSWDPDIVVVVGDVNSTLAGAIAANKCKKKLAHLESGLRSFDEAMPEEINRILTDSITDHYFITEKSGIENLQDQQGDLLNLHFVGNTMIDTLVAFDDEIQNSDILHRLNIPDTPYALMTMHRPRNVDTDESLKKMIETVNRITEFMHLVFPIHPRTLKSLERLGYMDALNDKKRVSLCPPLDYLSFQKLISDSRFVLTDSGGIQEETTFRQVPCLTLRPNTERPVTVELGTNELVPFDIDLITNRVEAILNGTYKKGTIPPLWDGQATRRIVKVLKDVL